MCCFVKLKFLRNNFKRFSTLFMALALVSTFYDFAYDRILCFLDVFWYISALQIDSVIPVHLISPFIPSPLDLFFKQRKILLGCTFIIGKRRKLRREKFTIFISFSFLVYIRHTVHMCNNFGKHRLIFFFCVLLI